MRFRKKFLQSTSLDEISAHVESGETRSEMAGPTVPLRLVDRINLQAAIDLLPAAARRLSFYMMSKATNTRDCRNSGCSVGNSKRSCTELAAVAQIA